MPVFVPRPLSSCELPCRGVHETRDFPLSVFVHRVLPRAGSDKQRGSSERLLRQAAAVGCANVRLAVEKKCATSQRSTRLKAPPHGSTLRSKRRRLLTGRCTPVQGLNSFLASCDIFEATTPRCDSRKPHEGIDKEINQVALVVSALLRASHATQVHSFHLCKDDAFFIVALHITLPKNEHATERCSRLHLFRSVELSRCGVTEKYKLHLTYPLLRRAGAVA